jgi:hypothetical protein
LPSSSSNVSKRTRTPEAAEGPSKALRVDML